MAKDKLDRFYGYLSFGLSLGFWIPLLNIPLSIAAIISGITALNLAHKYPERYGGRLYAAMGLVIALIPIVLWLAVLIIPSTRKILLEELALQNLTFLPK
jgi:nitrate/nitrite transporter NarK